MTELEKRHQFGMVCDKCNTDVPDNAYRTNKCVTIPGTGHFSLWGYLCKKCAPRKPIQVEVPQAIREGY